MQIHHTAAGGRRRAASVAGAAVVAVAATAFTALPAHAEPAPDTSRTIDLSDVADGSSFPADWQFDHIVDAGVQGGALRVSNYRQGGVHDGDITQLVTPQLGASASEDGDYDSFDTTFTIASATGAAQDGLALEVAPDNGSGSRTGGSFYFVHDGDQLKVGALWLPISATSDDNSAWSGEWLASVDASQAHTISIHERFVVGAQDTAAVYVDGTYRGTVGTYEGYANANHDPQGSLDSVLFREPGSQPNAASVGVVTHGLAAAPAGPAEAGHGYLISDLSYSVSNTVPLTVPTLNPTKHVAVNDLSFFDFSDTRRDGRNELGPDGLHVYTLGNQDSDGHQNTDKAAGYHVLSTPIPLAEVGQPSMELADGASGVLPGLQLGIDRDGDGTWDGYLVNEGDIYGHGNWWVNKDYFGVSNGGGYTSLGTLDDYLTANPNAKVLSFGYSLGSGVQGDATIRSITFGDTVYDFHGLYSPQITAAVTKGAYGSTGTVDVTVASDVTPTGSVTVSEGPFSATASLVAGKASVTLPASLAVGQHVLTVAYSGDADVRAGSTQVGVGVALTPSYLLSTDVGAEAGTSAYVPVVVLPDDATGTVAIKEGSTTLASAPVQDGAALVVLPKSLAVGDHDVTVAYSGDAHTAASTTVATVYVIPASASVSVSVSSAHYGTAAKATVKVTSTGAVNGGVVAITEGSKTLAAAYVSGGKASLTLPKTLKVGTHKLAVVYTGTSSVEATSVAKTVKVAKASAKASVKVSPSHVKPNQKGKATVTVTSTKGLKVNGKATVTITNKSTHRKATVVVTVKNGKASVKFPSLVRGTYSVSVKFAGSSTVGSATSKAASFSVHW